MTPGRPDGRGGRVLDKANWTSAANVEAFVSRFEQLRAERASGATLTMYERRNRSSSVAAFYQRLRRNGPQAHEDFKRAEEFWRRCPTG
jgi:hypothetical protein